MGKRKLNVLNVKEKLKIVERFKSGKSRREIQSEFKIPSSTLCRILKNSDELEKLKMEGRGKMKRFKKADYPQLEQSLVMWMHQCLNNNIPISGPLIKEKAKQFCSSLAISNFQISNGWLDGFKKRHDVVFRKLCGEADAVDASVCSDWKINLSSLINGYSPNDVFNADETGLFYKCLPNKTLTFKNDLCHGGKLSKDRITVLLCANMSGTEKRPLLIIGKYAKPRCFKNVKSLPVEYKSNKKAWMTCILFRGWLEKFDNEMTVQKRKVLLFIDNCTAHKNIPILQSIKIEFLPPNTTSHLQPLDQGIIHNFKSFYRTQIVSNMLSFLDENSDYKLDILQGIRYSKKAWHMVSQTTVSNCFRKCGFAHDQSEVLEQNDNFNVSIDSESWQRLGGNENLTIEDFINIDENIAVCGSLTDEDIIATVSEKSDEEEELDCEEIPYEKPIVTKKEAKKAISILQEYFELNANTQMSTFDKISDIETILSNTNNLTQTKISNFFM